MSRNFSRFGFSPLIAVIIFAVLAAIIGAVLVFGTQLRTTFVPKAQQSNYTPQEAQLLQKIDTNNLVVCPQAATGCAFVGADGIQKAIDLAAPNATILIRNGTYQSPTIAIGLWDHPEKQNLKISGESLDTVIDFSPAKTNGFIIRGGSGTITITALTLANSNAAAIYASEGVNLVVQGVKITDSNGGIWSSLDSQDPQGTLIAKNNLVINTKDSGIAEGAGIRTEITNNVFYNNAFAAIRLKSKATSAVIQNNIISNGPDLGIKIDSDQGTTSAGTVDISYNLFYKNNGGCATDPTVCSKNNNLNDVDPKFQSPGTNYQLADGSKAVNSGVPEICNPWAVTPPVVACKSNASLSRSDIGAYGGPGACLLRPNSLPFCK